MFQAARLHERCKLQKWRFEEGGGLTIPNVAELVVAVLLGAVVGEAYGNLDESTARPGDQNITANRKQSPQKKEDKTIISQKTWPSWHQRIGYQNKVHTSKFAVVDVVLVGSGLTKV